MQRILFGKLPGDTRYRYAGALAFSDGLPRTADTRYGTLQENFRLSENKGNIIIGESVTRLFEMDKSASCCADVFHFRHAGWSADRIAAEINEKFDYAVFAMANSIRPGLGSGHAVFADILERVQSTIVILGMGMQQELPPSRKSVDPGTARLLDVLNEKASVFGVRGLETEAWTHAIGITKTKAFGCPSLYVFPRNIMNIKAPDPELTGSVIAAGHLHIKSSQRTTNLLGLFESLNAHYVMQDEIFQASIGKPFKPDDVFYNDATGELDKAVMTAVFGKLQRKPLPFAGYWYFQNPDAWRGFCARNELYLGDRYHGGVAALQAGVPALILWDDLRVRELSGLFGIPSFPVANIGNRPVRELVAELVSPEAIEQFKTTFKQRFHDFEATMAQAGLPLCVSLSDTSARNSRIGHQSWWQRILPF